MRIGIFGGTFDPPHLGHSMACFWALETGEVDRILVMPVARHAFGKEPEASFEHRLEMCRLAMERLGESVEVSALEGSRPGVSYTIDTLNELRRLHPEDTFRVLIGSDVVKDLPKWRSGEEIVRLAPPLEVPRPLEGERFSDRPGALPPISSSEVREALLRGLPTGRFLSRAVSEYITRHGLYRQRATSPA